MKKTKIIATIGPACKNQKTIEAMAKAGMNVCRLNFSFGTDEEHYEMISTIRKASKSIGEPIAIMQDLQGPKIRVGKLDAPVTVEKGQEIILSGNTKHKEEFYLPTTYKEIASDTKKGKTILLADGKIILEVLDANAKTKEVHCKVLEAGTILTGKGINLPYTNISLPCLTEKDINDAIFGAKAGVDYMSLSFVRKPEDITELKELLKKHGGENIPIVSKIEKPEAVDNIDAIIDETDAIMVARGDLADEVSFAKVPHIQKEIIKKANIKGKPTIVATEMLSSMIDNQLPTRAEVSDVANSVLDGSDLTMLSNETAMGKYPVKAVKMMTEITLEAEASFTPHDYLEELELLEASSTLEGLCSSVAFLSYDLGNVPIAVFTRTGETPKLLSKFRPETTIFAATYKEKIYNKMAFLNNVFPVLLDEKDFKSPETLQRTIPALGKVLYEKKLIKKGQLVIIITAEYINGKWSDMNTIKVKTFDN
jgi:pyruvate kinase